MTYEKFEAWAKKVAHMIKDQRGYTPEQFEAEFLSLWEFFAESAQPEKKKVVK
jgi:hypothetical protein